jgi:hypothetical protein
MGQLVKHDYYVHRKKEVDVMDIKPAPLFYSSALEFPEGVQSRGIHLI